MKMSKTRGRSSGWAAFGRKQREKQGLEPEVDKDAFPPVTNSLNSILPGGHLAGNNDISARSFTSVLRPSGHFPTLAENINCKKVTLIGDSSGNCGNRVVEQNNLDLAFNKLKELHCWADDSLIEDILAAVNNNVDEASTLLKAMNSTGSIEEKKKANTAEKSSILNFISSNKRTDKSVSSGKTMDLTGLSSALEDVLLENAKQFGDVHITCGEKLSNAAADVNMILGCLSSVPVEPEWEEDDVYLIHRKEAIKMMRSASHHSKAAASAFLRGDHFSAQQHSLKAQEEWLTAERLNAKAAKAILSIRNSENDTWKLDLHGLHAAEAVQALQEHLQKIENKVSLNRSVSPNKVKASIGIVHSSSFESSISMNMENLDKQQASIRQRPTSLQVITGVGNHSRGQAALPTAVKSFLGENGYRFDEARPGVITVRPKFRHRQKEN